MFKIIIIKWAITNLKVINLKLINNLHISHIQALNNLMAKHQVLFKFIQGYTNPTPTYNNTY